MPVFRTMKSGDQRQVSTVNVHYGPGPLRAFADVPSDEMPKEHHQEYQTIDKRGSVTRAVGGLYVDIIRNTSTATPVGGRYLLVVLAPAALGGRLGALSRIFEQNVTRQMRVKYVPGCPKLTTGGSIMIYSRNDLGVSTMETGISEIQHAANYDDVVEVAVTDPCTLEINPSNLNVKYADADAGGSASSTTQAILEVLCVIASPVSTDLGSLFLEYDVEFFANSLDLDLIEVLSSAGTLSATAFLHTLANPFSTAAWSVAGGAGTFRFVNLPSLGSLGANSGYYAYGQITSLSGTAPVVGYVDDDRSFTLAVGQVLFFTFNDAPHTNDWTTGGVGVYIFADFQSMVAGLVLLWADTATTSFSIGVTLRGYDGGKDD